MTNTTDRTPRINGRPIHVLHFDPDPTAGCWAYYLDDPDTSIFPAHHEIENRPYHLDGEDTSVLPGTETPA